MAYLGTFTEIGTVDTASIADDAVTADKLANSINTEIAANTAKTGITSGQASAITANTAKVTNYNQTKADIEALGIAASSITGALPAISGASLTNLPGGGKVLQVISTTHTTKINVSTASDWSGANTVSGYNVTITPSSTGSKILIMGVISIGGYSGDGQVMRLYRGSTGLTIAGGTDNYNNNPGMSATRADGTRTAQATPFTILDSPSTTSAVTYSVKVNGESSNVTVNDVIDENGDACYGISTITAMEIGA